MDAQAPIRHDPRGDGHRPAVRVVIGEDEALLRCGLELLLHRAGMEVVAAVGDASTLVTRCNRERPDVVVTDGVGYLLKQRVGDPDRFCEAAADVARGGTVLDPEVVRVMMEKAHRAPGTFDRLTARQAEVLALIAEGRSNAAIAARLGISEKGVVQHTSRIYEELGLSSDGDEHRRVMAVVRYLSRE